MRTPTLQRLASLFVALAVVGVVGTCEARVAPGSSGAASDHAWLAAGDGPAQVAAPSLPAPPHPSLSPCAATALPAPPVVVAGAASSSLAQVAPPSAIPLYLRDRALLL